MAHIVEIYKGLRLPAKLQSIQADEFAKNIFDAYIQNVIANYDKPHTGHHSLTDEENKQHRHRSTTQVDHQRNETIQLKRKPTGTSRKSHESKSADKAAGNNSTLKGTIAVELQRKPGAPLGLGIAGGVDKPVPPIVSCLKPGSIVHRSDGLQVGDHLLSVNGIRITSLKHEDILTLLRNAGETITIEAEYDLNDICFDRLANVSCKTTNITLDKEGGSYGFIIRGGSWGPDPSKSRPLTVTNIRPGGPADREGRLRVSDRILAINSADVTTATHSVASQLLKASQDHVTLTVEYDVSILETVRNATGPLLLEIDKPPGLDLGVSLCIRKRAGTSDDKQHICIDGVIPASIGDRCGALHADDEILSIDEVGLEYTTLAEAHQLLKGANSNQIKLEIIPHSQMYRLFTRKGTSNGSCVDGPNRSREASVSKDPEKSGPERAPSKKAQGQNGPVANGNEPKRQIGKVGRRHSVDAITRKASKKQSDGMGKKQRSAIHQSRENSVEPTTRNGRADLATARQLFHQSSSNGGSGMSKNLHIVTGRGFQPNGYASDNAVRPMTQAGNGFRRPSNGSLTASVSGVPCGQVCHTEVMEVVLSCWGRGGYGLVLQRTPGFSEQSRTPLFISYIERGSPAEKSGVLQVGDRILTINDWCAGSGTAEDANYQIRHASGQLTLTVEFDVIETVLPSSGIFTVKLAKRGQNLGIVIHTTGSGIKGEPVLVSDIRTGSAAHRCGSINPGDQILTIDNIPLDSCTKEEAVRLLHRASDIVKLRIRKNPSFYDEMDPGPQHVVYSVELSRKTGPLGITIAGTDDRFDPIIISQMASNGLAERTGALHVGDRLLAINGISLQSKRVSEAIQILQQAGETVSLKIARTIDPSRAAQRFSSSCQGHFHHGACINENEGGDKLGTPVQSIDSAVESLEDSPPLTDPSQHPSTSSNRNSQNSKSSSLSGHPQDNAKYVEDLSIQLHRSLNTLKSSRAGSCSSANTEPSLDPDEGHYHQLGGEACPCQTNLAHAQDEWMKVLEALETVGEAEMLRKLEESILSGTVPCDVVPPCKSTGGSQKSTPSQLSTTFPGLITNTILRHPYSNQLVNGTRLQTSASSSSANGYALLHHVHNGNRPGPLQKDGSASNISMASSGGSGSTKLAGDVPPPPPSPMYASINHGHPPQPPPKPQPPHACFYSSTSVAKIRANSAPNCYHPSSSSSPAPLSLPGNSGGGETFMGNGQKSQQEHGLFNGHCSSPIQPNIIRSFDNIPYITSPLPKLMTSSDRCHGYASGLQPRAQSVGATGDPGTPSSIQLSGSVTPCVVEENVAGPSGASSVAMTTSTPTQLPLEIYRISLAKDKLYNDFGFSVSDGVTERGVYINKIRGGGPADMCGSVRPLDRILQVNDISLRDLDCLLAVPVLAAAGDQVDLIICRDPNLALGARLLYAHAESLEEQDSGANGHGGSHYVNGQPEQTIRHAV